MRVGMFLKEGEKENKRGGGVDIGQRVWGEKKKKQKRKEEMKHMDEMKWEKGEII